MKKQRQAAIYDLVANKHAHTQSEITELLREAGYDVTQATVSRDLRELGLVKRPAENGGHVYTVCRENLSIDKRILRKIMMGAVDSVRYAMNTVVVRTASGLASAVAKGIDELAADDILGCVAGDDTIIVVTANEKAAGKLCELMNGVLDDEARFAEANE